MRIIQGDFSDPRVIELLGIHLADARAATARGSAHALDPAGLQAPDIDFWTIWDGDRLVGCGALRRLTADHGEVKSMHVVQSARRRGTASALLRHVIAAARRMNLSRLSLETGSWEYFSPARALYSKHGFVTCPPFAHYEEDPNSIFMTLDLQTPPDWPLRRASVLLESAATPR